MALRLLVDADSQDKALISALRADGHDVVSVNDVGLRTADDQTIFLFARTDRRMVLTRNADDFEALHYKYAGHSGILTVYRGRDRHKDMTVADIARAISNIESAGIALDGQFLGLNGWQY